VCVCVATGGQWREIYYVPSVSEFCLRAFVCVCVCVYAAMCTYVSYGSPDTNGNERRNQQQFSRLIVTALRFSNTSARAQARLFEREHDVRATSPSRARGFRAARCIACVCVRGFACGCGLEGWGRTRVRILRTHTNAREEDSTYVQARSYSFFSDFLRLSRLRVPPSTTILHRYP